MIKKYKIENHSIVETQAEDEKIIVAINPENGEKDFLVNNYGIDIHNLSSSLDPEEPARIEFEGDRIDLIFKKPKNYSSKDHYLFKVQSIGLFSLPDKLIVVLSEDINIFSGKYFKSVIGIKEIF